ncbi:MAG: pseudouridine synthase [Patescibacteria group bacterium]
MSRREAEEYIRRGKILLNGKVVKEMGARIDPEKDRVEVLNLPNDKKKITVAVYKPRGIVCSKNPAEGKSIFDIFPQFTELNTVGRLDKESEGLLLLSNDGVVTAKITGEDHSVEKEYEVTTREPVMPNHLRKMEEGIMLDGKKTLSTKAKRLSRNSFSLILREGRNHQIRRMADTVHLTIEKLVRVRIGDITLSGLTPGKSRAIF